MWFQFSTSDERLEHDVQTQDADDMQASLHKKPESLRLHMTALSFMRREAIGEGVGL